MFYLRDAGEDVEAVDVHGAASADTLATGSPEGQARVEFGFDLYEDVEDHRAALVRIYLIRLHVGLHRGILRIPSVHPDRLQESLRSLRSLIEITIHLSSSRRATVRHCRLTESTGVENDSRHCFALAASAATALGSIDGFLSSSIFDILSDPNLRTVFSTARCVVL